MFGLRGAAEPQPAACEGAAVRSLRRRAAAASRRRCRRRCRGRRRSVRPRWRRRRLRNALSADSLILRAAPMPLHAAVVIAYARLCDGVRWLGRSRLRPLARGRRRGAGPARRLRLDGSAQAPGVTVSPMPGSRDAYARDADQLPRRAAARARDVAVSGSLSGVARRAGSSLLAGRRRQLRARSAVRRGRAVDGHARASSRIGATAQPLASTLHRRRPAIRSPDAASRSRAAATERAGASARDRTSSPPARDRRPRARRADALGDDLPRAVPGPRPGGPDDRRRRRRARLVRPAADRDTFATNLRVQELRRRAGADLVAGRRSPTHGYGLGVDVIDNTATATLATVQRRQRPRTPTCTTSRSRRRAPR